MGQGYFLSDLHLFTRRSRADRHLADIQTAASSASALVMGGDIFDFGWTRLATVAASVTAAERWLRDLLNGAPDCAFYYLLGNHDCHPRFVKRLEQLASVQSNFHFQPLLLRLGSNVFLHGDVVDRRPTAGALAAARARWADKDREGPLKRVAYHAAVACYLHLVVHRLAFPRRRVMRKIRTYLQEVGHGADAGAQNVYYGHTHLAVDGHRFGGLTFHNGGAPIKGLRFRLIPFDHER